MGLRWHLLVVERDEQGKLVHPPKRDALVVVAWGLPTFNESRANEAMDNQLYQSMLVVD